MVGVRGLFGSWLVVAVLSCAARTPPADVVCPPDEASCGDTCAILGDDPTNCGACGNVCPQATVCFDGSCATSCGGGTIQCGQSCVEPNVDPENCGACGVACASGQSCHDGLCGYGCPPGQTLCGTSCVSLDSDVANCGGCGQSCASVHGGAACVAGQCEITFCAAGYGDCDADPNTGCETDLSNDPANCGRCGHDCCGGACSSGACQPAVMPGTWSPSELALDATNVYWTSYTYHSIDSCPKTGCLGGQPTTVAFRPNSGGAIASDANNLYWLEFNAVLQCSKAACDSTLITLASGTWKPIALAVDGTTVYWSTAGSPGSIMSCAIGGCSSPTIIATSQYGSPAIAIDSSSIYFSDGGNVNRCPKIGCTVPQQVVVNYVAAYHIVIDGQQMYWTNGGDSAIERCDLGACHGTISYLGPDGVAPMSDDFLIDANNAYWGQFDQVLVCAKGGCNQTPTTLATGAFAASRFAQDASCIYFTGKSIWKLAKP